jgi:carbonic anhydrase
MLAAVAANSKEGVMPIEPKDLLARNAQWARERLEADPGYFDRLAHLQSPEYLWIGCADSRVPANVITGLQPGEVFVHRNVANLVYPADLNCMAVLQFAVEALRVKHVIVCGHYGCGGVRAAVDGSQNGLIDHWLDPIRDLNRTHQHDLAALPNDAARVDRLCELSVRAQVSTVAHSPIVQRAWEAGQSLAIHGWIYGLSNGLIKDLGCGVSGNA